MGLHLLTWNVNSVRARLDNVLAYLDEHEPDVVCLQETKVEDKLFPQVPFLEYGYTVTTHGTGGYAGVTTLTKGKPGEVVRGFTEGEEDTAPRLLQVRHGDTWVFNVYAPNGTSLGSEAFEHKLHWFGRLQDEARGRVSSGELVVCGDFNVAPDERDVWDLAAMQGRLHFTEVEHRALAELRGVGLHDCYRNLVSEGGNFTWFDYRNASFERGHGLRIDHVYATTGLRDRCQEVVHDAEPRGWDNPSDHLPVRAVFA